MSLSSVVREFRRRERPAVVPVRVRSVRSRYVITNGIRLFCLEAGPADGPVVLLLHGFPELAYSWRHQVAALGEAGLPRDRARPARATGAATSPTSPTTATGSTRTLIGVLDALGCERAVDRGPRLGRDPRVDHGAPVSRPHRRRHRREHARPAAPADAAGAVAAADLRRHADLHHPVPGTAASRSGCSVRGGAAPTTSSR